MNDVSPAMTHFTAQVLETKVWRVADKRSNMLSQLLFPALPAAVALIRPAASAGAGRRRPRQIQPNDPEARAFFPHLYWFFPRAPASPAATNIQPVHPGFGPQGGAVNWNSKKYTKK